MDKDDSQVSQFSVSLLSGSRYLAPVTPATGSYKMRKCESAKVNMYKMRKMKCESNVKINGRDTPIAVYSSAYVRVTLACC